MRFPASLHVAMTRFFVRNALEGIKRFPLVLMLEPTHRCNLACAGCDRIRLHSEKQAGDLTLEQCIGAAVSSRAPVVTITGGEPLLYEDLKALTGKLLGMKRHVYLCTNGILTHTFIEEFRPRDELTLNFHMDGLEASHDAGASKPGTFRKVIETIKLAKQKGFRVSTNTSVYKNSDTEELKELFGLLKRIGVDGILVAPAFNYERVENDIFLCRDEARERFRHLSPLLDRLPVLNSPLYIDFLTGRRQMRCTPWGNPTRNPLGWKSPCYLITDAYYASFAELMEKTPWEKYGTGNDPRCRDCMVHSGYEATAMRTAFAHPADLFRLILWNLWKP